MSDAVISVENLSKCYLVGHRSARRERYTALRDVIGREARNFARKAGDFLRGRQIVQGDEVEEFWALKDVSFEVGRGEVFGIIGGNGAGKSTLLKILSRITEPTEGRAILRGRVASLLEVGTGFHPELTGRENIFLNGAVLGMSHLEVSRRFDEIVEFAEVARFLDTPIKHYSSGMYVRLAFAVAAHLEPDILAVDEVLAVGDMEFQKKCLGRMHEVSKRGRAVLFVSHNMAAVRSLTSRSLVLSGGKVAFVGNTADAIQAYSDRFYQRELMHPISGQGTHTAIHSINMVDGSGRAVNQYVPGEPVRLQLTFSTDGSPGLSIELILLGQDQQKLGLGSLFQFHGVTLPASAGVYKALIEIEPIWLASGRYSFDVTTSMANIGWDHYVEEAIAFHVLGSNRGSQGWDFKQTLGYGAFALSLSTVPSFEKINVR
jgi:lipopolysaccharide transport system ATP-binding protein